MLSKSLGIYKRTNKKKSIIKVCPMCNTEFEVTIWEQHGMSKDANKGWHKRVYCDTCAIQRPLILGRERKRREYKKNKKLEWDTNMRNIKPAPNAVPDGSIIIPVERVGR